MHLNDIFLLTTDTLNYYYLQSAYEIASSDYILLLKQIMSTVFFSSLSPLKGFMG
jgi:hypothetical protein